MSKLQDKKEIVKEIIKAAKAYKLHLVGKTFLYVFDNRYIEVIYKTANFRHLTGVDTKLSAKAFYKLAVSNKLQAGQVYFSANHPYQLCRKKVKHLNEISALAGTESFMLEEITTNTKTYKFGTTDLNFTLCFNQELDNTGNIKGECYVAESLRDEDCFKKSKNVYEVTHIFVKQNDEKIYRTILYNSVNANIEQLPINVKVLLEEKVEFHKR